MTLIEAFTTEIARARTHLMSLKVQFHPCALLACSSRIRYMCSLQDLAENEEGEIAGSSHDIDQPFR